MLFKPVFLTLSFTFASCASIAGTLDNFERGIGPASNSDRADSSFFETGSDEDCLSVMGCLGDSIINNANIDSATNDTNSDISRFSFNLGSYINNNERINAHNFSLHFYSYEVRINFEVLKYTEEPINDTMRVIYLSASIPHLLLSSINTEYLIGGTMVQGNAVSQGIMLAYTIRFPLKHFFAIYLNPRLSVINTNIMTDIKSGISLVFNSVTLTTGIRTLKVDDTDISNSFIDFTLRF